jgi:hypothetical protein
MPHVQLSLKDLVILAQLAALVLPEKHLCQQKLWEMLYCESGSPSKSELSALEIALGARRVADRRGNVTGEPLMP